jgi:ATP-dependent Lon protease
MTRLVAAKATPISDKYLKFKDNDDDDDDDDTETDLSSISSGGGGSDMDQGSDNDTGELFSQMSFDSDDDDDEDDDDEFDNVEDDDDDDDDDDEDDEDDEDDDEDDMAAATGATGATAATAAAATALSKVFDLIIEDAAAAGEEEDAVMDEEEELFFSTLSAEEKQHLLRLESEISKINHKHIPLRFQVLRSHLPLGIKATAIKRLEAIQKMEEGTNEFHKLSTWIDGLLRLPFNTYIDNKISVETSTPAEITDYLLSVKEKLDTSVFGHVEAKSTLLEIVASWITNPTSTPTVIGLQGPPGTGKTTLIKDGVANALGRPFSMLALGGATDAAYLEGHSYTYEGSMWGRLAAMLMDTKCMNPVIFMDELDKVSETKHGEEIIGVLTHLVDYTQNNVIQDKYFAGIPLDFSKALFIFSFNNEEKLNPILKDRIHVIRTDKFTRESKITIAQQYLVPKLLSNVKFRPDDIIFSNETIGHIIDSYTGGECGVRNMKRCLESVIMKLNTLRLTSQNPALSCSPNSQLIPYYLANYKLPMHITSNIVHKLIGQTSLAKGAEQKHMHMYS